MGLAQQIVIQRDKKCFICGSISSLEVHHIKNRYFGGDNSYHNLITLCANCHRQNHETVLNEWNERFYEYTDRFDEPEEWGEAIKLSYDGYLRISMHIEPDVLKDLNELKIGKNLGKNGKIKYLIAFYIKSKGI